MTTKAKVKTKLKTRQLARTCKGRTRAGKPCRNKPIRGRDVCNKHIDQTTEGRPSILPNVRDKIYQALGVGVGIEKAAAFASVPAATIYRWLEEGHADFDADKQSDRREFYEGTSRTRASTHIRLAARIQQAGASGTEGDWRADAWMLERLAPGEFGQKAVVDHVVSGSVDVEVLDGRQPVDTPLDKRERILAILAEGEPDVVDATIVE